jgi:hypothetical protein
MIIEGWADNYLVSINFHSREASVIPATGHQIPPSINRIYHIGIPYEVLSCLKMFSGEAVYYREYKGLIERSEFHGEALARITEFEKRIQEEIHLLSEETENSRF